MQLQVSLLIQVDSIFSPEVSAFKLLLFFKKNLLLFCSNYSTPCTYMKQMMSCLPMCNIAGHDCSIRLWNLDSHTCVQEITSHRKKFDESIHDVAFHPSKPFIASAGADALAKVFAWCASRHAIAHHDCWCINECLWSTVYFTTTALDTPTL